METFYTIPSFPGYGINRRGEVKSPTGVILTVTERGQVRIKKDGKVRLEYIGNLLADAGQAEAMLAREKYEMELPCPCGCIRFRLKATPINRDEYGNPLPNNPMPE